MALQARWKDAVTIWNNDLVDSSWGGNPNKEAIEKFQCLEDLIEDLKSRTEEVGQSTFHHILKQIHPFLESLGTLVPVLAALIAHNNQNYLDTDVTIVWAVLYLAIKVCTL